MFYLSPFNLWLFVFYMCLFDYFISFDIKDVDSSVMKKIKLRIPIEEIKLKTQKLRISATKRGAKSAYFFFPWDCAIMLFYSIARPLSIYKTGASIF